MKEYVNECWLNPTVKQASCKKPRKIKAGFTEPLKLMLVYLNQSEGVSDIKGLGTVTGI